MRKDYFEYRFQFDRKREIVWKVIAKYLQRDIPFDSKILEIGAGYCDFINNIRAKEKHALDIFKGIKKYVNRGVITHIASCTNMKLLKKNYFDVVFASNLFEHLSNKEFKKALLETRRVLKKNGKLIIIQPNFRYAYREYFNDYTHKLIFTDVSLCDTLEVNDFIIEKCVPRFLPLSLKSKFPASSFLLNIYLHLPFKPLAKQMLIIARKK